MTQQSLIWLIDHLEFCVENHLKKIDKNSEFTVTANFIPTIQSLKNEIDLRRKEPCSN
jgi:hypothetical protein